MSERFEGKPEGPAASGAPEPEPRPGGEGTVLPSGAVVRGAGPDPEPAEGWSRRKVLAAAGIGAGALAVAGGAAGWWFLRKDTTELRLAHGGGVCEAPLYVAYEKGFFAKEGLKVTLSKVGGQEDTHAAVGSGKYAGTPGIFFSWLKPIEDGQDVKLVAGLHEGCLRLVVLKDGPIKAVEQLRGKKIGVSGLQSSALNFFSLDLLDAGIVPSPEAKQVQWVVYDDDALPKALEKGDIDAIAASDPVALLPVASGQAVVLADNMRGHNAEQYCCATAVNGELVRKQPAAARKLVTAWAEGSRWIGESKANLQETVEIEAARNYVAGTREQIEGALSTYSFHPSAKKLKPALIPGIEKFAKTGFLNPDTDPHKLADKVYGDLGLDW